MRLGSIAILISTALAGCSSPSPTFSGIAPQTFQREGWSIDVYLRHDRAQAIRTNMTAAPSVEKMERLSLQAITDASNCAIVKSSVWGDTNVINVILRC